MFGEIWCKKRKSEWSEIFRKKWKRIVCLNMGIELLNKMCCADSDETLYDLIATVYFRSGLLFEWMERKFFTVNERELEKEMISTCFISIYIYEYRGRQIVTSKRIKHPHTKHGSHSRTHTFLPFSKQKIDNMNKLFDYCKLCSLCSFV